MKNTSSHTNFSLYDTWWNTHPLNSWVTDMLFLVFSHVCYAQHTILISFLLWVCSWENVAVSASLCVHLHRVRVKVNIKVKVKLFLSMLCRNIEDSRGIAPLIGNLSTLLPGKNPCTHCIQRAHLLVRIVLKQQKFLAHTGIACMFHIAFY